MKLAGQPEVNLREVDEHGHRGRLLPDGLLQLAELAPDARQVVDDLGQPHHRHLLGADDALEAGSGHARPAHAEEAGGLAGGGKPLLECLDHQRPIVLAAGLAGRDEDGGGHGLPRSRRVVLRLSHHSGFGGGRFRFFRPSSAVILNGAQWSGKPALSEAEGDPLLL